MKTIYFLPKDELVEEYKSIFDNVEIECVELFSFDKLKLFISSTISSIKEEVICLIPAILDPFNSCSYDGVEFALRCYFYYASNKINGFRIAILGSETETAFWEHCNYSNILKCPHVDYIQNNVFSIKQYLLNLEDVEWTMNWEECIDCLKKIGVQQPASYKTHHSITNEWSIYRWSKYLGVENIAIQKDIEDFLYFNYLKAIYPITEIGGSNSIELQGKGKVLLIDDEAGKGWHDFFKHLFSPMPDITFDSMGDDFKKCSKDIIIERVSEKIKNYYPDVVILDLRLHDNDFDEKDPRELTGNEILSRISNINPGIQIILFSASNKVWNYINQEKDEDVQGKVSAKDIIIKESPELSSIVGYTAESITHLCDSIKKGLRRSAYLKEFYDVKKEFLQYVPEDFDQDIAIHLNAAFSLLNEGYLSLSLFYVIQSFESYCNYFTHNVEGHGGIVYRDINKKKDTASDRVYLILGSGNDKEIHTKFKPLFGTFSFQQSNDRGVMAQHVVGFQYSENDIILKDEKTKASNNQNEAYPFIKFQFAVKAVAVLHSQLGDISKIESVLEWIFIRNNKLAHIGSEYNEKQRPITENDILQSLKLLNELSIIGFKRKIKK